MYLSFKRLYLLLLLLLLLLFIFIKDSTSRTTTTFNDDDVGYRKDSSGFKVKSSTITRKKANVMGSDIDMAIIDIEFDRDIYHYVGAICPNYTCPNLVSEGGIDCTCDYTDRSECPKKLDESCDSCDVFDHYKGVSYPHPYCLPERKWTTIQANTRYYFGNVTEELELRLKANSSSCVGYQFYASQDKGAIKMNVDYYFNNDTHSSFSRDTGSQKLQQITICPNIYGSKSDIAIGTYIINIKPISKSASFSFITYENDVPPADPNIENCTNINNSPSHQCANDGALIEDIDIENPKPRQFYYTFSVDHPMALSIGCPAITSEIVFFVSDSHDNQFPSRNNFTWASYLQYDNYLTITIRDAPKILYISFEMGKDAEMYCVVSSHFQKNYTKRALVDNHEQGGSYLMMGSSRMRLKDGSIWNSIDWNLVNLFYPTYPRMDANPIYPTPTIMSDPKDSFNYFKDIDLLEKDDNPTTANNRYQAVFIISVQHRMSTAIVYSDFENVANGQLDFTGTMVDINGQPLDLSVRFTINHLACNYSRLQSKLSQIETLKQMLFSRSGFDQVSSIRFNIDIITLDDSWVGCSQQADSLLEISTKTISTNSIVCPYPTNDPMFSTDPCCNSTITLGQCCLPRLSNITIPDQGKAKTDLVSSQCSSPGCTTLVLNDYYVATKNIQDGNCSLSYDSSFDLQSDIYTALRRCKSFFNEITCSNDSQCTQLNGKCHLLDRYCYVPFESIHLLDKSYLSCVINNISLQVNYFLKYQYNLESFPNETKFIDELYDRFSMVDWIGIRPKDRKTYSYISPRAEYSYGCKINPQGEELQYDIRSECQVFESITDQSTCLATESVCLLRTEPLFNLTETECQSNGYCKMVGYSCGGPNACIISDDSLPPGGCRSIPGTVDKGDCTVIGATELNCTDFGYGAKWYNCPSMNQLECFTSARVCTEEYTNFLENKDECETIGGQCSDDVFSEGDTEHGRLWARCVRQHNTTVFGSGILTCNYPDEVDSPLGCYHKHDKIYTEEQCLSLGANYKWWLIAKNEKECLSHMGCRVIDTSRDNLPQNYRFNEMNESMCNSCSNSQYSKWTNMFTWTTTIIDTAIVLCEMEYQNDNNENHV
ncbi:hypothetical protein DFA_06728 [Cavenderia fasciculata]|uniref:Uncharacterized protein n=1 Tax=Cavenderia fasciculata TaxID=261658 RepID=F4Q241_CACFS|nr:uncharacterized protein DFA_06728 [Cavenderia fasciculata]EGG18061.1 hypothetical protein DFA_06728 [Cavenderia fasciculata]|eukprot:XP_004356954.1 hypothetical protein DFA_06728 [Cavenderia fasciculata]